jgi:phage/plasmid-like protein (TIGR03299 family)
MAHELDFTKDGTARFAYARDIPWHKLGTAVGGLGNIDTMLKAASADYEVLATKVAAVNDDGSLILNADGTPVIISDSRATIRKDIDGTFSDLATVGTRYEVRQNREVAERALAVVGASEGDAVIETCGVLREGRRFFMTIDLGALIIDPAGINDKIARYLVVSCGHDGVWPIRYANTDIRAVCNNTVVLGIKSAQRIFTARHTRNVDSTIEDAQAVLKLSTAWAKKFREEAENLLRLPLSPSSPKIGKVLDDVFPLDKMATDRQRRNHHEIIGTVRAIYGNERNAGGYGYNGWSLLNAITEYLDHAREAPEIDKALASMDENSWVTRTKMTAHQALLSIA